MQSLIEDISPERQEKLLNPKSSDHYETFFYGKYGRRLYTIKVGRKWVYMRSNAHKARITFNRFKSLAFSEWKRCASTHALTKVYEETGKYKYKNVWWRDYGFETNPLKEKLSVRDTLWK